MGLEGGWLVDYVKKIVDKLNSRKGAGEHLSPVRLLLTLGALGWFGWIALRRREFGGASPMVGWGSMLAECKPGSWHGHQ